MNWKNQSKPVIYATLIILLIAACFLAAETAVRAIPLENVPEPFVDVIAMLQNVFNLPIIVLVVTFVRGVFGFYRAQFEIGAEEDYELSKFGETLSLYLMVGITATAALPAPWNQIAIAITFFVDVIKTEYKYFKRAITIQ